MPRGASKGERRGGRTAGVPNKATIQRAIEAEAEMTAAEVNGKKLGKDYLEEWVSAFHNMAAFYQNKCALAFQGRGEPSAADKAELERWGKLVVSTARDLAEFQSPKFRAIAVAPAPAGGGINAKVVTGNVVPLDDNVGASRIYRSLIKQAVGK